MHAYLSTNKRSVIVRNRAQVQKLAAGAALVMDDRVGEDRLLDVDVLSEIAPNSVLLSITWFGQSGPYRDHAGSDGVCLALSSQLDWLGNAGEAPLIPGGYHAQMVAGLMAFVAAMGQVLAAELGNAKGVRQVDLSILESSICLTEIEAVRFHCGLPPRTRRGVNRFRTTYPLGIYPCQDGWLGVTVLTPSQWEGFCRLIGLEYLTRKERYWQSEARFEDADQLDKLIADAVKDSSAQDLVRRGQETRVPLSIVPTMEQLFGIDQYIAREVFADVVHPDLGEFPMPVTPFRLYGSPARAGGHVARLGEHSRSESAPAGVAG